MNKLKFLPILFLFSFSRATEYGTWIDSDYDCQDTRQEVLIAESLETVVMDKKGCKVISGKWHDKYTGAYYTDPKKLDIDHLVPLGEVEKSGGKNWSKAKKISYTNDLKNKETLIAVSSGQNRAKGDRDPAKWMPKNKEYHCQYLKDWRKVKITWELSEDVKESKFINERLRECN